MKKLLMMVIMMMSLSVFAQDKTKEVDKEIKAFEIQYKNSEEFAKKLEMLHDDDNVNVIVDAEVTDIETVVEPMQVLVNPDKPSARMNLAVYQKITFKINEAYKSDEPINEYITIAIEGGKYFHNLVNKYKFQTDVSNDNPFNLTVVSTSDLDDTISNLGHISSFRDGSYIFVSVLNGTYEPKPKLYMLDNLSNNNFNTITPLTVTNNTTASTISLTGHAVAKTKHTNTKPYIITWIEE